MDLLKILAAAGVLAAGPSAAHVSVSPTTATAGSYQVFRFGVRHGCDGEATTQLRLEIPDGAEAARPQPKPDWSLSMEPGVGAAPRAIVWDGRLPADQFDEFVVLLKLPPKAGPMVVPAIQSCGRRVNRWIERPTAADARPKSPAPLITLTPAAPPAGHDHH